MNTATSTPFPPLDFDDNGKFADNCLPSSVAIPENKAASVLRKPTNPKDSVSVRKAPMSTVSALVITEVGVAMLEGGLKYGRHNYRVMGVLASVYYDATMRHLQSWWEGEDIDIPSDMSHVTKAITSLIVLRDAMITGKFTDDRPPTLEGVADFFNDMNERAAKLVDRDGHIKPMHFTNSNKGE